MDIVVVIATALLSAVVGGIVSIVFKLPERFKARSKSEGVGAVADIYEEGVREYNRGKGIPAGSAGRAQWEQDFRDWQNNLYAEVAKVDANQVHTIRTIGDHPRLHVKTPQGWQLDLKLSEFQATLDNVRDFLKR